MFFPPFYFFLFLLNQLPTNQYIIKQSSYLQKTTVTNSLKTSPWDFPGGPVVENPFASAGDTDSIPGPGRSHIPWGKWAPCTTATEPTLRGPRAATTEPAPYRLFSATREAAAVRSLHTATRESPRAARKTQCSQNQIIKFFLKPTPQS